MVRSHFQRRRLARVSAVIGAAALLGALCTPAALMAQGSPAPADPASPAEPVTPEAPPAPAPGEPPDPAPATSDPSAPDEPDASEPAPAPQPAPPPAPAAAPVAASGGTTVTMADFSFSPATITVSQGDTVTWTNSGPDEPHTATGDGFDTGQVAVGSSGSATFSEAGDYPYVCTLHANMSGTVRVLAAASGGGEDAETTPAPAPGSEAAAVAAPDAAGTASKLPATGLIALPLALIGLVLLVAGLRLRR